MASSILEAPKPITSVEALFASYNCPLHVCFAWGAQHKTLDLYLLKCWDDQLQRSTDGTLYVHLVGSCGGDLKQLKNVHARQRYLQVQKIQKGGKGFIVLQSSLNKPIGDEPRKQGPFDRKMVWPIDGILWTSEGAYAQLGVPIAADEFRRMCAV